MFIELIMCSNSNGLYAYHSLLEGPLDLEALGLSLHSLLLNPAVSVHNLRVATQKLIPQYSVFRTTLLFLIKQKQGALLVIISENFVYTKYSRPLCWQFWQLKQ